MSASTQRQWFVALLLGVFWLAPLAAQTLRVGYFALPPHVLPGQAGERDGKRVELSGPAVDYLSSIARHIGATLQFTPHALPLDRLLAELRNGSLDVAIALGRSPEREAYLRYPEQPFFQMQSAILVRADSSLQVVRGVGDLYGLKVAVYSKGYLSPLISDSTVQREALHGDRVSVRNLAKLLQHRVDAVYSPDRSDLQSAISAAGVAGKVRLINLPEPTAGLYTAFASHVDAQVVQRYQAGMRAVGPYEMALADTLAKKRVPRH